MCDELAIYLCPVSPDECFFFSRYRGKRMRVDYFIVSEKLKDRIVGCEMHGQGIELQGNFLVM